VKDPKNGDTPIVKLDKPSKDKVVLGSTKEMFGSLKARPSMLKYEFRARPIKFEYIMTECIPVDHQLGNLMEISVTLSDLLLAVNDAKNC
jgi:hypothetical protein